MSMTRAELEEKARALRQMAPGSSNIDALSNELTQSIQQYVASHPFETEEMGIVAGDADEGPTHKICVTESDISALVEAARANKRVALEGKPGFGRLYAAQELAYILIGREQPDHVVIAEFNESYTFEDFMGITPAAENFLQNGGLFYRLCQEASRSTEPYVLVINETVPGKVDEVFRQLDTLISTGAGQEALEVLYGTTTPFSVPDNVYVYALTAVTGSNALPPHSFVARQLKASMQIIELVEEAQAAHLEELQEALAMVEGINSVVTKNLTLGARFCIHQNFVCPCTLQSGQDVLAFVVERDLSPLVTEYSHRWAADWAQKRAEKS